MDEEQKHEEVSGAVATVPGIVAEVAEMGDGKPGKAASRNDAEGSTVRFDDLERRIRELEAALGDLRTVDASAAGAGRKTQASYAPQLLSKGAEPAKAGRVDAALGSLSVEQRMAVKAGLLRAGIL